MNRRAFLLAAPLVPLALAKPKLVEAVVLSREEAREYFEAGADDFEAMLRALPDPWPPRRPFVVVSPREYERLQQAGVVP